VDCVIRVGVLGDSSLVGRRVGAMQQITCASPAYLARHGEPTTIEDLDRHVAVNYFGSRTGRNFELCFLRDGNEVEVAVKGVIAVNDADAYTTCGLEGLGLMQPARFMVLPHLRSGALREVLREYRPPRIPISAVYPHNRHLSPKVRVFVDWVAELFERCPLLQGEDTPGDACSPEDASVALAERDTACDCVV